MTPPISDTVRHWVDLLLGAVDETVVGYIVLGGSRARPQPGPLADTDLFVMVQDNAAMATAVECQLNFGMSGGLLVSSPTYRVDFGVRIRVASSPTASCSFHFLEPFMIRNVAHQRKGVRIWPDQGVDLPDDAGRGEPSDDIARVEELTDGLLEFPAALKYLARHDYFAASIRLARSIVSIVNYKSGDPAACHAGSTKNLPDRLQVVMPGRSVTSNILVGGSDGATVQQQITAVLEMLADLDIASMSPPTRRIYSAYVNDVAIRLRQWESAHRGHDRGKDDGR